MKYTIEGFSQEYATTLRKEVTVNGNTKQIKIDCTDLVILRWFVDFFPKMNKMSIDGQEFAVLSHKKLMEDMPILDISKRACIERMQKLVEFGILEYRLVKEGGTFSLYKFGENYQNLISSSKEGIRSEEGGIRSNDTGVYVQPTTKDNSIIDNTIVVLKNNDRELHREEDEEVLSCYITPLKEEEKHPQTRHPNEIKYIVGYLNQTAGTHYRANTDATKKHIIARLNEGFTIEDFETVINFKSKEWLGTKYSAYLRPETLFGSKFESYLNQATIAPKNILDNVTADDLDDVFDRF